MCVCGGGGGGLRPVTSTPSIYTPTGKERGNGKQGSPIPVDVYIGEDFQ